jgi:hypothetical protein
VIGALIFFSLLSDGATRAYGAATNVPAIEQLLPASGFAKGWVREGKVELFTKENLYEHINGEAELYMPYGFEALAYAVYGKSGTKEALAVDLYRMGSAIDAFGIYSNYRSPDAETVKAGAEGFFDGSQLMFYQDSHFARISASGEGTPDKAAFMACAAAIGKELPSPARPPKEIGLLNIPQVVLKTEKYIAESLLGYAFFKKGLTAEATLDNKTVKVFVVLGDSPEAARQTLDLYINSLRAAKVEPRNIEKKGTFTLAAKDPLYRGLVIRQSGPYLFGVTNLENPEKGIPLLDELEKKGK